MAGRTDNIARVEVSGNPELFCCERNGCRLLVELIKRRTKGKECGDTLDHLPEPATLVVGQRLAVAPIGLAIAEPFLERRVAPELISPDQLRDMREIGIFVQEEIARPLAPRSLKLRGGQFFLHERPRLPASFAATPIGHGNFEIFWAHLFPIDAF